jgi:membrane-associated protease RseP (regulator of RpoE activity)
MMLMLWIFVFSLGVGIVNILPIKPLDGGLLFEEIVGHFTNRTKYLVRAVSGGMLLVLLFNLIGPVII